MKRICFLLLPLLWGCSFQSENQIETIEIGDVSQCASSEPAFTSIDYVKLETSSDALLADVAKVVVHKDRIYVLSMFDARVFIFSSSGEYITSLRKGQGPGEVLFVSDMDIREDKLFVLDNYRYVRQYDLDGNYISDVYTSSSPRFSLKYVGDDLLLFDPYLDKSSDYLLHQIKDETDKGWLLKKKTMEKANFLYYNFYSEGFISWPMCDTIYHYNAVSSQVRPQYAVHFSGKSFYDIIDSENYTNAMMCEINQDKSYYRWIQDVTPYESGVYFSFHYDKAYFVKYEQGKATVYSEFADGLPPMITSAVGHAEDKMIYAFTAGELLEYKEKALHEKAPDSRLVSLYESLSEDDNPVLFFVSLAKK